MIEAGAAVSEGDVNLGILNAIIRTASPWQTA